MTSKPETNLEEALEYDGGVEIIPFDSLEPRWTVPGATEGGFLRYLTSWVGGPEGHINPNFGLGAVVSQETSVGYMKLMTGCRQKGIHAHTIVEIYIILKGEIEGFDGTDHKHYAGPMDCVYIPKGVPHGVRNSGTEDLDLLWIHDGIEKKGLSTYYFEEGSAPKIGGVSVIKFNNLEPHWAAPKAKEAPFLRYAITYVGGKDGYINTNPKQAALNDKTALGMMVIYPGNGQVPHSLPGNQCYVICQGRALITKGQKGEPKELRRLDGIWIPKGTVHSIRNPGHELLWVMWSHEVPQKADSVKYQLENIPAPRTK